MDYQSFQRLREPAWREFEELLGRAKRRPKGVSFDDLGRLTLLYRQVLHDHSVASARYAGTSLTARLGRLVLEGTHWLQRDSGEQLPSLRRFVTRTFPHTFRLLLPKVGITAALFCLAALLGFALTATDPALGGFFLPAESVANLARGEIWTESIFAVTPAAAASAKIATNNLGVCLTAWAGGALAGFGALYIVLLNGLMLGSVIAVTARYSMDGPLFDFIAAHGPLEISLILVSAAAGLHMGQALVRAHDEPRSVALVRAGRESLIVLFGCLPFIFVLGFIEGYISPSAIPLAAKATLGWMLEAIFLLWALAAGREPEASLAAP